MLVVDASAVTELLLDRPVAEVVRRHLSEHEFDLHAPHLIDLEVLSAIRRLVMAGASTGERGDQAVDDLLDLPMERYSHEAFVRRAWELRENLSPYDAAYFSLAEVLERDGASLLTADGRFARAAEQVGGVDVILAG